MQQSLMQSVQNISTNVYDILRRDILTFRRKPGEPIDMKQISNDLQVSRAPVRDALMKLRVDGLVDIFPQRGTYVSKIDLSRVEEERFLRKSLELSVLPLFLLESSSEAFSRLSRCIQRQREAIQKQDYTMLQEYDDAFHSVFFLTAKKEMCWNQILSISGHYMRIRLLSLLESDISEGVIAEHDALLETALARDQEKLIELSCSHFSRLNVQEKLLLEKYPEYFPIQMSIY